MRLVDYNTNETIEGYATPDLCAAAVESDSPVLAMWSDESDQWEMIDQSQVATLRACRPEPRIVAMYGLP